MSGKSPLFRAESLEARRLAWLGRPIAHQSVPLAILAGCSLAIGLAIFGILVFGEYTRRVPVQGVVLPNEGLTRVVAPASGWVTEQLVKEGESVRQGDVLYVLGLDSTTAIGNTQSGIIDILHRKRAELQQELVRRRDVDAASKKALLDQERDFQREIAQSTSQLKMYEEFATLLQSYVEKQQEFVTKGMSTSRDYESRLQTWMSQRSQIEALKRDQIQLETKLSEVRNSLLAFDQKSQSSLGELRRAILDIEAQISEGEARREVRVTAPRDGRITSVLSQAGQTVTAGATMVTILPQGVPLEAQLIATSKAIGFVREGARVLLRYEAYPYQKFGQYGGTISLISRAPLRADEAGLSPQAATNTAQASGLYRIIVTPDRSSVTVYGREEPLQIGMQVEAHVLAETRPLYQWVLDPIYGLLRRSSESDAPAESPLRNLRLSHPPANPASPPTATPVVASPQVSG
jgi:membrane fusion protein